MLNPPSGVTAGSVAYPADVPDDLPHASIQSLNHTAIGVQDLAAMRRFYVEVLQFCQLARPDFPFDGTWLEAGGLTLHLIAADPTVPLATTDWREQFSSDHIQSWWHRRGHHLAFAVRSAADMEKRLQHFQVPYSRFTVPGTNAAQLFLLDVEGNGIELGSGYDEVATMLRGQSQNQGP
eukprot:jgi/Astpho2/8565/fgenesh1_pg.00125_%23_55_t